MSRDRLAVALQFLGALLVIGAAFAVAVTVGVAAVGVALLVLGLAVEG